MNASSLSQCRGETHHPLLAQTLQVDSVLLGSLEILTLSTSDLANLSMSVSLVYHQNQCLAENIVKFIRKNEFRSILDIGAGGVATAVPISKAVQTYFGLERDKTRASRLKDAGLAIVCGEFPTEVPHRFDMVLSSHSVPEGNVSDYRGFLDAAWAAVAPGGLLLIVTFKGVRDDTINMREEITGTRVPDSRELKIIEGILSSYGPIEIGFVNSYAESDNLDEIIEFVIHGVLWTEEERGQHIGRLRAMVEERYKCGCRYVFPTRHIFLSCARPEQGSMGARGNVAGCYNER